MGDIVANFNEPYLKIIYPERIDGSKKFGSNYIRKKVKNDTVNRLRVDSNIIDKYEKFLISHYVAAIQRQIPPKRGTRVSLGYSVISDTDFKSQNRLTRQKEGYATGNLVDTVKATSKVTIHLDKTKGRYEINYYLTPNFNFYGEYIASGRKAGWIPVDVLVKWIDTKINAGVMTLRQPRGRNGKKDIPEEKLKVSVAYMIAKAARNSAKPPVVSQWYNMNRNQSLKDDFNKSIKSSASYYRGLIRENVINKMNIKYGNTK